jgi:hypothetical protein
LKENHYLLSNVLWNVPFSTKLGYMYAIEGGGERKDVSILSGYLETRPYEGVPFLLRIVTRK